MRLTATPTTWQPSRSLGEREDFFGRGVDQERCLPTERRCSRWGYYGQPSEDGRSSRGQSGPDRASRGYRFSRPQTSGGKESVLKTYFWRLMHSYASSPSFIAVFSFLAFDLALPL